MFFDSFADFGRRCADIDAGGLHGGDLVGGLSTAARNNRARVSHAASRGRGLSGDESYDGFLDILVNIIRGRLLGAAADLADHNDRVRIGILVEQAYGVDKCRTDDGVAADPDASGLADAQAGELA